MTAEKQTGIWLTCDKCGRTLMSAMSTIGATRLTAAMFGWRHDFPKDYCNRHPARLRYPEDPRRLTVGKRPNRPGAPSHYIQDLDEKSERVRQMVEMREEGMTLKAIGEQFNITRERVRQLVKDHAPTAAQLRKRAHQSQLEQDFAKRCQLALDKDRRCMACGYWVLRGPKAITCTPECAEAWTVLRHIDNYHSHRLESARSILANADSNKPSQVEWAQKMLSDEPPPPNRRYFVPGSKREEVVRKFRPELYRQIVGRDD